MALNLDEFIQRLLGCVDANSKTTNVLNNTEEITKLLDLVEKQILSEPILLEVEPPVNIAGDIHGQYWDLVRILDICGRPPEKKYLFLGDYVDRANYSLETISLLFAFKVRHPTRIYLLRGNHESSSINKVYGFYDECCNRFPTQGKTLWDRFIKVFDVLPFVARVGGKILCMHGGLSPDLHSIDQLRHLPRPVDPRGWGLHIDLLWADPDNQMPCGPNDPLYRENYIRGISYGFSVAAVQKACTDMGLDLIVRGHQVVQDGYEFFASRKLVTIFSAPNYCGEFNNKAAILHVDADHKCSFTQIDPLKGTSKIRKRYDETDIDDELDKLFASPDNSKEDVTKDKSHE